MMYMIGHWKEGDPCDKVANNLAELYSHSRVCVSHKTGYLAEAIFKQRVKVVAGLLLTSYSKMQKSKIT